MSNKKERVVFTALSKISKDRNFVYLAYQKWAESKDQIEFKADSVVEFLEKSVGLNPNEKRNFRIALYALSARSENELLQVPDVLITGDSLSAGTSTTSNKEHHTKTVSSLSPEELGFQALFESLVTESSAADEDALDDLAEHFQDKKTIKEMKLSKPTMRKLSTWASNESRQEIDPGAFTLKDMKSIIHQAYICVCETLGPVKADRVLSMAMNKASKGQGSVDLSVFI